MTTKKRAPSETARARDRREITSAIERCWTAETYLALAVTGAYQRGTLSRAELLEITGWSQATFYRRLVKQEQLPGV